MGWRTDRWEARKRRDKVKHSVSVLHDAAQAHLLHLLSAHGVALSEHPIAVDRRGKTHGAETLWRTGDLFGQPPTFEALRYADYWPMIIFDLVTATHEGVLLAAFEIIAFAPPNARKLTFLKTLPLPVYSVSARGTLSLTPACPWLSLAFRAKPPLSLGYPFELLTPHVTARNRQFTKLIAPPPRIPVVG